MYLCLIITIDRERSTLLVTVNTFCVCVYFAAIVGKLSYLVIILMGHIDGHESKPANSNFSKKILFDNFEGNTFLHNVLKNLVPSMSLYPSFQQLSKPAISHRDTFQRNKTG